MIVAPLLAVVVAAPPSDAPLRDDGPTTVPSTAARATANGDDGTRFTTARVRLAAGGEWDTNARRAIQDADEAFADASRPSEEVSDGLVRVVVDGSAGLAFGRDHGLSGYYVLGAKRFVQEDTEDLLVQEIGLSSHHRLGRRFDLSPSATYKGSRIRSSLRDYDVLTAGLRFGVRLARSWQADLQLRATRFTFAIEPRFDFVGPRATVGLRFLPSRRWTVNARGGVDARYYDGNALVEAVFVGGPNQTGTMVRRTFCENPAEVLESGYRCTPAGRRRDVEGLLGTGVSYRGRFLVSAQYTLRLQRSNSDFENIDRHRVELSATLRLPGRLTLNALGALQINQGVSITDQKFLADDDENQNSLQVGLRRPISSGLHVELRYALFANQFSTAAVAFVRHTGYLGLGYRADLLED